MQGWKSGYFLIVVTVQPVTPHYLLDEIPSSLLVSIWPVLMYTGMYTHSITSSSCIWDNLIIAPEHATIPKLWEIVCCKYVQLLDSSITQLFAAKSLQDSTVAEDDLVSSTASSRRESYCSSEGDGRWRRRSSTSDVMRFRQRMRQASGHESHEELQTPEKDSSQAMGDCPNTRTRTEPEITITAASASSHESTDTTTTTPTTKSVYTSDKGAASSTEDSSSKVVTAKNVSELQSSKAATCQTTTSTIHPIGQKTNVTRSLIENETYDL